MKNQADIPSDHEEIMPLLPWYVNQTLEEHQRGAVVSHIKDCDECQREVAFLTSLSDTVQRDAQSTYGDHADIGLNLANVMSQIDATSQPTGSVTSVVSSIQQKLRELFNFSTALSIPQLGATALAGILVAVLGFQIFYGQPDDNYSVLSSSDIENPSMRLSVKMVATDNEKQARSEIQQELDKTGKQVDIETGENGAYIIVFRETIGVAELSNLIENLESASKIEGVKILP